MLNIPSPPNRPLPGAFGYPAEEKALEFEASQTSETEMMQFRRSREVGKEEWKKESGYHCRSLIETAMMRIKTLFSERLKAREWKRQETELRVRCAAMNRMTALGMPKSVAV